MDEKEKIYSEIRKDFHKAYKKEIAPYLKKTEKIREQKLIWAVVCVIVFVILAVICILCMPYIQGKDLHKTVGSLPFVLFAASGTCWYHIKKGFENSVKEVIMPLVCKCFWDISWNRGFHGDAKIFEEACIISPYSYSSFDDYFTGTHKNVTFEIIESKFTKQEGKQTRTVFAGVIIKLSLNKSFSSHTVIKPDSLFHISPSGKLRHTELEDVLFEKKFDVFTNDEIDARYLITPTFMERLNNVKTAFDSKSLCCAFYKEMLFIGLSTDKDLFSLCSLVKPLDDSKPYFQMFEEIISIIKLIDHFKLDQKIGL